MITKISRLSLFMNSVKTQNHIAIFKDKQIRKTIFNKEWWFVVEDVVSVLVDTANAKDYINKMRVRDPELSKGYGQIVHTLEVPTMGGKQKMNCANVEGLFRTTTEIHRTKDTQGVPRLKDDARVGGQIAGTARKQIERKLGRSIISKNKFLGNSRKRIEK